MSGDSEALSSSSSDPSSLELQVDDVDSPDPAFPQPPSSKQLLDAEKPKFRDVLKLYEQPTTAAAWKHYIQIQAVPLFLLVVWLLLPLYTGDRTTNFWLYTFLFVPLYSVVIHFTFMLFMEHFVLPGVHWGIRVAVVLFVQCIIIMWFLLLKFVFTVLPDGTAFLVNYWYNFLPGVFVVLAPCATYFVWALIVWRREANKGTAVKVGVVKLDMQDWVNSQYTSELMEEEKQHPLRAVLFGSLYLGLIVGIWFLNASVTSFFAQFAESPDGEVLIIARQTLFGIAYQIVAMLLSLIARILSGFMTRKEPLRAITIYGLDCLFSLYYRFLFLSVDSNLVFGLLTALSCILYFKWPILMHPKVYHFVYKILKKIRMPCVFCDTFEEHIQESAGDFFFGNTSKIFATIASILYFVILRFYINNPIWKFGQNETIATDSIDTESFNTIMIYYGIQAFLDLTLGFVFARFAIPKLSRTNVDVNAIGSALMSNVFIRLVFIGFALHFVQDVVVFYIRLNIFL